MNAHRPIDLASAVQRGPEAWPMLVAGKHRVRVLQVVHPRDPATDLDAAFVAVENPRLTRFFESAVIAEAVARGMHREADYFGVVSSRFRRKIPLSGEEILARMAADGFAHGCYSFFGRVRATRPWPLAEGKHPGISRAATELLERLGVRADLAVLEAPIIYQNHFLCRSEIYQRYVDDLLAPALRAMDDESDRQLQDFLACDPHYSDARLEGAELEAVFGRPRYTMHPFVAERLFSTWLGLRPEVSVRHLWRGRFVAKDDIVHEPEMRSAEASA